MSETVGNLRHLIDTCRILNVSDESTVSADRFPFQNGFKPGSYIVSDVDEELLLLVSFHDVVDLHSIKIHALPLKDETKQDDDDDSDEDEDDDSSDELSAPKQVQVFKIDDLSKDFSDIKEMKANYSLDCKAKKLGKGQLLNLKKKSKNAVTFGKIRCLAIFIQSNQNATEKTYISGLILSGKCDAKLAYDIPYHSVNPKKKEKHAEIVSMFDKLDKRKVGLRALLKSAQSQLDQSIPTDTIHSLLSYISRMPSTTLSSSSLHQILHNDSDFASQWIAKTLRLRDANKKLAISTTQPFSTNSSDPDSSSHYADKMSFALMKIFTDEEAVNNRITKPFLTKKLEFLLFHCLLVFHPESSGNTYHAVEILKTLFAHLRVQTYSLLTQAANKGFPVIRALFRYALISRAHDVKFGEFLMLLLVPFPADKHNKQSGAPSQQKKTVNALRAECVVQLKTWNVIETLVEIATNPNLYGSDVANKYGDVVFTLLKQCAKSKETAYLFSGGSEDNVVVWIVDRLLRTGLDRECDKWYRIHAVQLATQVCDDMSGKEVLEKKRGKVLSSDDNFLFSLFDTKVYAKYMSKVMDVVMDVDTVDVLVVQDYARVKKPLGLFRLKCFELLMKYLNVALAGGSVGLRELVDMEKFKVMCMVLIEMSMVHCNNNLFLVRFRELLALMKKHCVEVLTYMVMDCEMLQRFRQYYSDKDKPPSAMKSFVIDIVWDLRDVTNVQQIVDSTQDMKLFMSAVETQINLQKVTKV